MRLLQEGVREGFVIPTEVTRKLTMDGVTKIYQVYKIKLSCLYYNDQNDRIATWISKYKVDNGLSQFDFSNIEEYNSIIQDFIISSNPTAIEKTKSNINMVDQREPGVVLDDGRIIDGNRRFTCLRMLSAKDEHFGWFEAVILDKNINDNKKEIKMLELMIQHGEEGRVDYNPIDRLVGVYKDVVERKLLTIAEYAKSTNEQEHEVKKRIELAGYMVEFLEYINAPKQFYIARDLELEGPLIELAAILRKCPDEARQKMKISIFNNMLMKPENDMTKFVRQIKSVVETEYVDDFIEEQVAIAKQVEEIIPEKVNDTKTIQENIRQNEQIKEQLSHSMDRVVTKVKRTETRNKPALMLDKSIISVENIDIHIVEKLNEEELYVLRGKIDVLRAHLDNIEGYISQKLD